MKPLAVLDKLAHAVRGDGGAIQTIDDALRFATALGRVKLEQGAYGSTAWQCEIKFKTPNDSTIWAKGENSVALLAAIAAIEEAIRLGARP